MHVASRRARQYSGARMKRNSATFDIFLGRKYHFKLRINPVDNVIGGAKVTG